jgi:cytochrome P450
MANALIYLMWYLSQFPDVQDQLRDELLALELPMKTNETRKRILPSAKELDLLPVLHAVIMETLRVHSPVAKPQPRETPYPSCKIAGYEIPGGVRIAAAPYILHRAESIFPDATRWDHTRWLNHGLKDGHGDKMRQQFWAFGSGGRMCVASHFVMTGTST